MDSIKITAFGFNKALEGTLKGTLYDFKVDTEGDRTEYGSISSGAINETRHVQPQAERVHGRL